MHIYNALLCYITLAVNERENAVKAVINNIFPHLENHGNTTTDLFILLLLQKIQK